MKLTKDDVGKIVRYKYEIDQKVLAIDRDSFWATSVDEIYYRTWKNDGSWEIIEEPKLPSERIREIVEESNHNITSIDAISKYLDEEFQRREGNA
jgi:hypothetical protein